MSLPILASGLRFVATSAGCPPARLEDFEHRPDATGVRLSYRIRVEADGIGVLVESRRRLEGNGGHGPSEVWRPGAMSCCASIPGSAREDGAAWDLGLVCARAAG